MLSKKSLLKSLENLPDEVTVDELVDRIFLLQKIETGLAQSDAGLGITTQELRNEMKKWRKAHRKNKEVH